MNREYNVTQALPDDRKRCLAFGYATYCCELDMDEQPDWHDVTFSIEWSSYKLKKEFPKDPEESILEFCESSEHWRLNEDEPQRHLVGVTKWKYKI